MKILLNKNGEAFEVDLPAEIVEDDAAHTAAAPKFRPPIVELLYWFAVGMLAGAILAS